MAQEYYVYRVKEGDTLKRVARKRYGSELRWREIFEDNRHLLEAETDRIRKGQRLRLKKNRSRLK